MAKKKVSRKELLKAPDEFITISSQVMEYFKTHVQELKITGIVLLVIVASYFGYNSWKTSMNHGGQTAYNTAVQSVLAMDETPGTEPAGLIRSQELFKEVLDNYGSSGASRLALPQIAHLKFLEKNYTEAITYYQKFLDDVSGEPLYETLTKISLAECHEANGEYKTAVAILTPLAETPIASPFKPAVMWHLARVYRLDGNPQKATDILKELIKNHENSAFSPMAKALI